MKPKNQRLLLAVLAFVALTGAGLLAAAALRDTAAFFRTPSELAAAPPGPDQPIRLGGMVKPGSIDRSDHGGEVRFVVQDGKGEIAVRFTGITPDLFIAGSGVVAEGHMAPDGSFRADYLLARHDENYVPREMRDMKRSDIDHLQDSVVR